jgi:hypothetical protein
MSLGPAAGCCQQDLQGYLLPARISVISVIICGVLCDPPLPCLCARIIRALHACRVFCVLRICLSLHFLVDGAVFFECMYCYSACNLPRETVVTRAFTESHQGLSKELSATSQQVHKGGHVFACKVNGILDLRAWGTQTWFMSMTQATLYAISAQKQC